MSGEKKKKAHLFARRQSKSSNQSICVYMLDEKTRQRCWAPAALRSLLRTNHQNEKISGAAQELLLLLHMN
jgi:hypothetical protein